MSDEIRRFDIGSTLEIRAGERGPVIRGHAAVYDQETRIGWFREKVARGAFDDSIASNDIRALWNHDSNFVLGRNKAGTLELASDERGLAVTIHPPNTGMAEHIVESIKRGDVTGMSFGFRVKKQEWDESDEQNPLRTLLEVDLIEVSPVAFPAYPQTDVSARAAYDEWRSANHKPQPPLDEARYRYARILASQIA